MPAATDTGALSAVAGLFAAESQEMNLIAALRGSNHRAPFHLNDAFETDAEILDLGGPELLAVNIDTLHSGSELAMAERPFDRGWLTVTATISDLAAVAARPRAVILSCSFNPSRTTAEHAREFSRGAAAAASEQGAHLAGGDTNWSDEDSFTGCAIGVVSADQVLRRVGARPGDSLYVTGPVGAGNAAGARHALGLSPVDPPWRPTARCAAGLVLAAHARACIDTSDGVLSAALMLADVNGTGVEICDHPDIYDPAALELVAQLGLPAWLLAAGEWGEYELLFAVEHGRPEQACLEGLSSLGLTPRRVGRLLPARESTLVADGRRIDAAAVAGALRSVSPGDALAQTLSDVVAAIG